MDKPVSCCFFFNGTGKEDLHSTRLDESLSQVAGAPGMRCHGYGVAGKRVGFDHAAGEGAPHDTCLSC